MSIPSLPAIIWQNRVRFAMSGKWPTPVTVSFRSHMAPDITHEELTVFSRRSITIKDAAAYGLILTQGFARGGVHRVETPSLIRFGELTNDELFVSADAA